jgi:hypothetical protein
MPQFWISGVDSNFRQVAPYGAEGSLSAKPRRQVWPSSAAVSGGQCLHGKDAQANIEGDVVDREEVIFRHKPS